MTIPALRRALGALMVAAATGCLIPLHGRVSSAHPLEGVATPVREQRDLCGGVWTPRRSPLVRAPYVQLVTPTSAVVRWSSRSDAPEHLVLIAADERDDPARAHTERARELARRGDRREREVRLAGLSPGRAYCYSLRGARGELLYGRVAMRTAPPRGSERPVDVLVVGDSGGGASDQYAVRDRMLTVPADLALHVGDLAYPSATVKRLDEVVFDVYERLLRSIPIYPALGNHDLGADGGDSFLEAFVLPPGPGRERWYSLDWGPLHVAVLDTNGDLAAQARWLAADLEASDAPFEIVVGHHPPYSSGPHGGSHAVREHVSPVLERSGVRLAIFGHDHHYERSRELRGVTYVVTGGGGHSVRAFEPREHSLVSEPVLHFLHLRVSADALSLLAIDARGQIVDAFRIER